MRCCSIRTKANNVGFIWRVKAVDYKWEGRLKVGQCMWHLSSAIRRTSLPTSHDTRKPKKLFGKQIEEMEASKGYTGWKNLFPFSVGNYLRAMMC